MKIKQQNLKKKPQIKTRAALNNANTIKKNTKQCVDTHYTNIIQQ